MSDTEHARLTLDLAKDRDPIQGRIHEEHGPSREFVGWLGLAAALGEAIRPPTAADGARDEATR